MLIKHLLALYSEDRKMSRCTSFLDTCNVHSGHFSMTPSQNLATESCLVASLIILSPHKLRVTTHAHAPSGLQGQYTMIATTHILQAQCAPCMSLPMTTMVASNMDRIYTSDDIGAAEHSFELIVAKFLSSRVEPMRITRTDKDKWQTCSAITSRTETVLSV